MERVCYTTIPTPWVPLLAATSGRGLLALHFVPEAGIEAVLRRLESAHPRAAFVESAEPNRRVAEELAAYAAGELRQFTVPLDLRGTPFQMSVWKALRDIPYGETRTYAQIARATRHPKAFRAVGGANHSNPIGIIVPCHRVISSNGGLCGYGGGLELKKTLLDHERSHRASGDFAPQRSLSLFAK
jgi:O-6-methylguanine DNA methyltransferase